MAGIFAGDSADGKEQACCRDCYYMVQGDGGVLCCPDAGKTILDGMDITDSSPKMRGIGMVYRDYMLFHHMTFRDNIGFGLR